MDLPVPKPGQDKRRPRRCARACTFCLRCLRRATWRRASTPSWRWFTPAPHPPGIWIMPQGDWVCRFVRWPRRARGTHDRDQQRFWQRVRFAGGRDYVWRRSGNAGLDVGISSDASGCAYPVEPRMEHQAHPIGGDRRVPVSDGRSQPPGAVQYHVEPGAFNPGRPGRNIL